MDENDDISFVVKGVRYNYFNLAEYCKTKYWDDDDLNHKSDESYVIQKHIEILKKAISIYNKKRRSVEIKQYADKIKKKITDDAEKFKNVVLPQLGSPYYIDDTINYDEMSDTD